MNATALACEVLREAQREAAARAEMDEYNLWCGIYGSPASGGWALDPRDGRQKPLPEIEAKEKTL